MSHFKDTANMCKIFRSKLNLWHKIKTLFKAENKHHPLSLAHNPHSERWWNIFFIFWGAGAGKLVRIFFIKTWRLIYTAIPGEKPVIAVKDCFTRYWGGIHTNAHHTSQIHIWKKHILTPMFFPPLSLLCTIPS